MTEWFPSGRSDSAGWRFNAVGLLAVIGESSIAPHVFALTSSWLCLLPRLIPAPQAMLKPSRPTRFPAVPANVVGVHSGTSVGELNFYADLIHQIGTLKPYDFHEYTIRRASKYTNSVEDQIPLTFQQLRPPVMSMRAFSPLDILAAGSCALTVGLLVWACLIQDGVAIISLAAMASASVLVGLARWHSPQLSIRPTDAVVPDGDIIIRTREGAFIVVKCSEEIARELYTGAEEAKYFIGDRVFKLVMGAGTVALMVAVVLLGNCSWTMQVAIGTAYLLLNSAYWVVALFPKTWIWDISPYEINETTPPGLRAAHMQGTDDISPSYTRTLWYAIQSTKKTSWISISGAAPETAAWKEWERLAYANSINPDWDAVGEKDRLMRESREREYQQYGSEHDFTAANNAPNNVPPGRETL